MNRHIQAFLYRNCFEYLVYKVCTSIDFEILCRSYSPELRLSMHMVTLEMLVD